MGTPKNHTELEQHISELEKKIDSLSKERNEYLTLFDSILFGIQEMDTKGTIVYANKAYHESRGYEDGELIGKSMLDFAPTEDKKAELAAYLEYLANEQPPPTPWIGTHLTKDGSQRDIKVDWNYKRNKDGTVIGLISLFTEITEKKKLQKELDENKSKFEAIFNSITDAVVFVDQQREIIMINKGFTDILGYEIDEVEGKTTQFFYANPDEYHAQGEKRYQAGAAAKSPVYEIDYLRKDGTVFPSETLGTAVKDDAGEIIGFIGVIRDISARKKAEVALKESKEIFHLLMDSLEAIVYVADMDTYEVLFLNKYGQEVLGDVTGKTCWQSLQADQTGPCDFCTNKYLLDADGNPGSPYIWDFQNTLTGHWFHITDRAIKWIDGRIVRLEIATDISDSKKAEMALKESEEKYSKLFNSEIDAIAIFEADTRKTVDCNDAFLKLYGYSREEALQLKADDISAEPEKTAASIEKEDTRVRRRRHKKKDGSMIIVDIAAGPFILQGKKHMFARLHDITKHVRNEGALHESEERFRIAFLTSPDSININKMDGTYVEINEGFTELTGYSRKDVIGISSKDINIWDNLEDRKTLVEGLQKNGKVPNLEAQFRMKDGTLKTGLMSASIIDLYGEPHILNITRDITDRKQAEREKEKLESQLRQVYKMEAIGTMAGGIAHDFNNVLTIILGNADLARYVTKDDGPAKVYIDHILEASGRAKEMVSQILTFSRKAIQNLVTVKPQMVLNESLSLLRSTIPSTVEVRQNFDTECRTIKADPTQLNQIMLNLSANAVHAMDEKGLIDVSLQEVELTDEDTKYMKQLKPGSYAMLTVTDTGRGMSSEVVDRIFDPFFTTKKFGEGTGMGLSVVHGIVESHGGMILAESSPGEGATIRIYFPIIDDTDVQDRNTSPMHYKGDERILFVDDEESLVEIGTEILRLLGYQVTATTNSLEAFETFKKNPGRFDLVITDQTMPKMSGLELVAELLKIRPDIPIILCTGYSSKITDKMAKEIGLADFFMKPFDTEQLAMIVRKTLDRA
jgi:PAS domain S-box-containing protein